jgi:hypothetical protein
VVNPFNFEALLHDPEFEGKLEMIVNPLSQNKPYFLILSKQFTAARADLGPRLWRALETACNSVEIGNLYARHLHPTATESDLRLNP